ncbi:methionyl-tRNA formyltransferase [Aminithiophilus ramosus]|uniref:Methionyl-tRNA formyltransferase n=2 Tax=Synergistales TaxID=649776 RepID=A0A9Q7ETS9_9BACT|nr:methionyl-tRNA formyltransferase [Aminithiophilus ramosus]QTX31238.1 methionyl-tRNA formyltransferase [Aminithiophilus ramosus]QVL35038.1 methionyl-tRNA formyltransferase [Synergistota bacterium]
MVPYWFMGSGDFGRLCLVGLLSRQTPTLVISAPSRPAGRGLRLRETPVAREAVERGLPLHLSPKVNSDDDLLRRFDDERPQVIIVVDFGQMIGEPYLSTPPWGCLNAHPSLLPLYRGAAPLQRALMAGDKETGISVFRLVPAMDAGPILAQSREGIENHESYGHLLARLAPKGGILLQKVLELLEEGLACPKEQDHAKATFAPVIRKEECPIRWIRTAREIACQVRALNPSPGTYALMRGRRLKIWQVDVVDGAGEPGSFLEPREGRAVVACGRGALALGEVQPEGGKRLEGTLWWRGLDLGKGESLS